MSTVFISRIPESGQCLYKTGQNSNDVVTTTCRPEDVASAMDVNSASVTGVNSAIATDVNSASATSVSLGSTTTPETSIQGQVDGTTIPLSTTPVSASVNGTAISSTITPAPHSGNSTAVSPASPTAVPDTNGKGLAGGAVAGVAVGMLLAGVLIAGLIFFFLLRRQKRRHNISTAAYSPQNARYSEHGSRPEKGTTVVTAAVGSIDDLLPQPVEDDAITGALSKIRDNIKNHVRTYYHSEPVSATDMNEAGIRNIAALAGSSAAMLSSALTNPASRDNALRLIVGSIILARCTGERSPSLLPGELAGLVTSISEDAANNSQSVLFSKWKVITGALLQQRFGKQSQDPGRLHSFQDAVISLDSVLAPFVKGSIDGGQRRKNLDMILTRAANFAFLLFTQPGSFRLDFTNRQGGLTVFPALVQTVGDQGQPLNPVKVLIEQEVVAA